MPERVILQKLAETTRPEYADTPPAARPAAVATEERFEQRIVAMLLQFPEILPEVIERKVIGCFSSDHLKAAAEAIVGFGLRSPAELPELLAGIGDTRVRETIAELAMADESWGMRGCRALLARFLEARQKHSSDLSLQRAIETAERNGNESELLRLLQEKQRLAVRRERQKMSILREKS